VLESVVQRMRQPCDEHRDPWQHAMRKTLIAIVYPMTLGAAFVLLWVDSEFTVRRFSPLVTQRLGSSQGPAGFHGTSSGSGMSRRIRAAAASALLKVDSSSVESGRISCDSRAEGRSYAATHERPPSYR
jgi:hypothetical protein